MQPTRIAPLHALAIQTLRTIDSQGGSGRVTKLAATRRARAGLRQALRLAAREGLVTSLDGETYRLTDKAIQALENAKQTA